MPKCDFCEKDTIVRECRIKDNMGTRYRNLCDDCIVELSTQAHIDILNTIESNSEKPEKLLKIEGVKLTTSPSFEGYRIVDYKGIIFDETLTGIGIKTAFKSIGDMFASLTGEQMYAITNRISELEKEQINRLKLKAVNQGANAIVSIDFERTMPGGSVIMVSATGTAVVIEKVAGE